MSRICVFCSSSTAIDPEYLHLASAVGTALAARGHDLVSGGGGISMMGALARAARAGGAHTLGIIPAALRGLEVADEDADQLIVTSDMRERKGLMDDAAEAFLALPGGLGTLEELLEIWVASTLAMHHKPIVVLDPSGVLTGLRTLTDSLTAQGFVRPEAAGAITWTTTVTEALDAVDAELLNRPDDDAVAGRPKPDGSELLEAEI